MVVPPPAAVSISKSPFIFRARRLMLAMPWPSHAAARSKPTPSSVTVSDSQVSSARKSILTREQFATRYGLEVETLRNWEIGRREADTTARSYLRAIANDPERVERAYAPTPPR